MKQKKDKIIGILYISLGILLVAFIIFKIGIEYRLEQKILNSLTIQVHSVKETQEALTEVLVDEAEVSAEIQEGNDKKR